jgi:acyl CoA:acetate/3-ketoacid CoA transferase beta subunit
MAEILPLGDAVAELVHDGDSVALEGFTHLIPFAAGHELLRQRRRDLELIRMTPDLLYDQLIGIGAARKLVFSYGGNPGVGSLHRFRDAIEHGWPHPIEIEEHSHAGMANRYAAGAAKLPFAVLRGYLGTDLAARTRVEAITCPFTGERLTAVPALNPDVAIVHAQDELSRDQEGGRRGPRRFAAVLQPRDHRARQRLLSVLGRAQPGPGRIHGVDEGQRARRQEGGRRVSGATPGELQTVVAARRLRGATTAFIGVGRPSTAAILARMVHNPELVLIYESGTIGAKPFHIPLSIGDGELAQTADFIVSVPEMFNYWIGAGRVDVAFLGAAQVDRYANLNSTVIGDYEHPTARLPGAGGAPEIAASCGEVIVVAPHNKRTFVQRLDFCTTVGHGDGAGARERLGFLGAGPTAVITDLGVLEPDTRTKELVLTQVHAGIDPQQVRESTGWKLAVADDVHQTEPPTAQELAALRELVSR